MATRSLNAVLSAVRWSLVKIKRKLCDPIYKLRDSVRESYENQYVQAAAPCHYFGAIVCNDKNPLKVSCANCRVERMVAFDNALADTDCYTLMIIDFLKSCGVEVEDD